MSGRFLIVNADDFGQSPGINRGVIRAHEQGIVTSTSLMVRWPAAVEAAGYCRSTGTLDLGLHIDLGEWTLADEAWVPLYEVVPVEDPAAVDEEVRRQVSVFRALTGRDPTHLDSHQHVHLREACRPVIEEMGRTLGVPVRHLDPQIRYCGDFYGQDRDGSPLPALISAEAMLHIIENLPQGTTELCCHPGEADGLDTLYRSEREQELRVICDPAIRAAAQKAGIRFCSFPDIGLASV